MTLKIKQNTVIGKIWNVDVKNSHGLHINQMQILAFCIGNYIM